MLRREAITGNRDTAGCRDFFFMTVGFDKFGNFSYICIWFDSDLVRSIVIPKTGYN